MKTSAKVFRFGRNELDVERYELRRMGKRLRLSRSLTDLLILLLERRGKLVTREEIAAHLWTNPEMVDVVQGINTAINRLRGVLNDDTAKPRYIETVVGKGYRFIAEVDEEEIALPTGVGAAALTLPTTAEVNREEPVIELAPIAPVQAVAELAPVLRGKLRRRQPYLLLACAAALTLAATVLLWQRHPFSPPEKWAFRQFTANDSETRITASAISPDGRLLTFADAGGINLKVIQTGSERILESPPNLRVDHINWFADDLRLAVSGYVATNLRPQIWVVFLTGESPRLLEDNARNGVPSPDGKYFAFTKKRDQEIWVAGPSGEDSRPILAQKGSTFPLLLWSFDGERLVYERQEYAPVQSPIASPKESIDSDYRWDYGSVAVGSGRIVASVSNVKITSACILPDGRMIFSQVGSGTDMPYTLWEVQTDPSTGAFRTPPKIVDTFPEIVILGISASLDGKEIAAVFQHSHMAIYVAEIHGPGSNLEQARRITFDTQSDYPHAWTSSGDAVIFESSQTGQFEIYKQRLDSGVAEMLAWMPEGAVLPQVTPGGKWILFAGRTGKSNALYSRSSFSLYRVPIKGGNPQPVPIGGSLDEFRCSLSQTSTCVLRETIGHQQFVYYALDPITGKGRELGRTKWSPTILADWDISPDGSTVAIAIHDRANPRIRIVPLTALTHHAKEREIPVPSFAHLSGVVWAVNGKGFYGEADTDVATDLLYIDLEGNSKVLRESASGIWGVPNPDGTKLAFVDRSVDSNVWLRQ